MQIKEGLVESMYKAHRIPYNEREQNSMKQALHISKFDGM